MTLDLRLQNMFQICGLNCSAYDEHWGFRDETDPTLYVLDFGLRKEAQEADDCAPWPERLSIQSHGTWQDRQMRRKAGATPDRLVLGTARSR